MSGHSKWATTKRKKAVIDAKRSKVFTKVAKLITIAARDGKSGDPNTNPSLRLALDNARAVSMPKENIERAIKRGLGTGEGAASLEEIVYEAYGPGGVAILIECLTDNRNRALSEIKATLNKAGGSIASPGSVGYLFKKVGQIILDQPKVSLPQEELEMAIIESGASDFSKEDSFYVITCDFLELNQVKASLEGSGVTVDSAEPSMVASNYIDLGSNAKESLEKLLDTLDDLDDVNEVYSNANL